MQSIQLPFVCRRRRHQRFLTKTTCNLRMKKGRVLIKQEEVMRGVKYPSRTERYGGDFELLDCGACEGPVVEVGA